MITQGAIIASALGPAMKVWVPHEPNGVPMIRRFPQGAHPRCLVRFVFTDVSSTARQSLFAAMRGNKDNTFRVLRHCWNAVLEPVFALSPYLGTAAFGGHQ